jgi:protein-S-isoprenylcysteine O-methyltransferase Ste14
MRLNGRKWIVGGGLGAVLGALFPLVEFSGITAYPFFAKDEALLSNRGFLLGAVALWALFGLYWDAAAKGASKAKSSEAKASRTVHVFLANAALVLEIVPIVGLGRLWMAKPAVMASGLAVEVAGLALTIWARRHLGPHWSGEITIKVGHELVQSGPYGRLRHPIYTGLLAMYLGLAIVTGERLAAIGFLIAVAAYWRKVRLEERILGAAFGAEWDGYRRATWGAMPGVF